MYACVPLGLSLDLPRFVTDPTVDGLAVVVCGSP